MDKASGKSYNHYASKIANDYSSYYHQATTYSFLLADYAEFLLKSKIPLSIVIIHRIGLVLFLFFTA